MRALTIPTLLLAVGVGAGCGGGTQPPAMPAPAASAEPATAPTPSATAAASPEPAAVAEPKSEGSEPATAASAEPSEPDGVKAEREVKFVVSGNKVEVRVDGVRFRPTAKAIRVGGGWGVRLTVEGEAEDDKLHSILSPKAGALAFAGKVSRNGKEETLSDERAGDEEAVVAPGTPVTLERVWPAKGGKPLVGGDKLELHVGLWGLGADAASRRPVKRFLIVSMRVDKGEPRPMLAPPQ